MLPTEQHRATVLAAVLLTALLTLVHPGTARAAGTAGTVDGVQLRDGQVELVLTSGGLPAGASVDPSTARVTIGGREVRTTATVAAGDSVERRLVILVDVSGSMRGTGIDAAKAAAAGLISQVAPDVLVGLVAFNDTATVLAQPTTDRAALMAAVQSLSASRETALYDGVEAALASLGTTGDRTLVVLSDGGDTVSRTALGTVTQDLAASGVRAEVVGFRTDESQDAVLTGLAAAGRGRVTTTEDAAGIGAAFLGVAQSLSAQVLVRAELPDDVEGLQDIVVSVDAGSTRIVASSQVQVPPRVDDAPDVAIPLVPSRTLAAAVPVWLATPWVAVGLTGTLVLLVALLVLNPLVRRRTPSRIEQLEYFGMGGRREAAPAGTSSKLAQPVLHLAEDFVRRRGLDKGLALLLDRADLPWRPHEYLVLRGAAALALLALAVVVTDGWLPVVVAPTIGWLALTAYVRLRARARMRRFTAQLPEALALVASSLQTGFSLDQALESIGRDTADPLRGQIARAVAETRLGADLEDSLDQVAHRMACDDLGWTVMAIRIQRQVGGNLAETLRTTTSTLRERASLRRHVKALSADGRISAYVLVALPFVLVGALLVVAPDYISMLWSNPIGILMLVVAGTGMVVGSLWMRQLVRVEL